MRYLPAISLVFLFIIAAMLPFLSSVEGSVPSVAVETTEYPFGYDPEEDPLVAEGFRPRYPSPDSPFIQTLEPMPEDAVIHPYGWTPNTLSLEPTRATWTHYYDGAFVDVYVDTSSQGGGSLSSSEQSQLDRIIDDFEDYSWPIVKENFDPLDRVDQIDFKVHKIDGPSGTGGYYQPGTEEFHLDRDDFSWGGTIAAHEFQHMVHRQYDINENLWVDEGCADLAAYLVFGFTSGISSHVYAYLNWRPMNSVVVDDYTFYQDTTTSYYGSSFLFQLYLYEHYGGKNYTHGLVRSSSNGRTGVSNGLAGANTNDRFDEAFEKFMVALSVNDRGAEDGKTYSYSMQSYPNGNIRHPLMDSHSGGDIPISKERIGQNQIYDYSLNSFRFSSPPEVGEIYRLKLDYTAGNPIVALYYETSPTRTVEHIDFGGARAKYIDLDDWGINYTSFRLISSSSADAGLRYELDVLDLIPSVTSMSVSPFLPNGDDGWYTTSPKITLTTGDSRDKIYYRLNGGTEERYTEPIYIFDGVWNLSYNSVDRHNNIESTRYLDIKVDTDGPTSSMVVEPDIPSDVWYTSVPRITINTAHPNAVVEYKFNNDEYQVYTAPIFPPEGESNFFWRSRDQAGNTEMERSRAFKIDTIAPTMEYSIFPETPDGQNGWYISNPTVTLSSPDAKAMYYSLDNGVLQTYINPFSVPDGTHTIKLLPIDKAGNQGEEVRIDLKVDTAVPSLNGSFGGWTYDKNKTSVWISAAPTLIVEGSEGGMFINYSINGEEAVEYSKPIQIEEGITELTVQGMDYAGNPADPLQYYFKVDLKKPYVESYVSEEPVNGWYLGKDVEISLELTGDDDRSSPVIITYMWKGGEEKDYRHPLKIPEGDSTLIYWATDMAGNMMDRRSMDFLKDSTLPAIAWEITGIENGTIEIERELVIDLTMSDDENSITFYAVDFDGDGDFQWSPNPEFRNIYMENGSYSVVGYVKDRAGNVRQKLLVVTVVNPKETDITEKESSNGSDLTMAFILIGVGVLIIMMMTGVLAFVLARRRQEREATMVGPGHHLHAPAMPPGMKPSPSWHSVPPPPVPPGHVNPAPNRPGLPPTK
jgi:hypothetical protein